MRLLRSTSPAETRRWAAQLGTLLRAGDVVALRGALGAGKTCFVQGLARGLRIPARAVASPTFTIVREMHGRLPLYHLDLYRISDESELAELGLEGYLYGDGVCAVEWIDRFPSLTPGERVDIELSLAGEKARDLSLTGHGARGRALVEQWLGRLSLP